jgi:hypothetical protein
VTRSGFSRWNADTKVCVQFIMHVIYIRSKKVSAMNYLSMVPNSNVFFGVRLAQLLSILAQSMSCICFISTAGWSSGLWPRLRNYVPGSSPGSGKGFRDEQLHLLTSHGCLSILLSI